MDIKNHQNLQDRLRAAHLLLDRSPQCPVVVDTMTNQSSSCYAALPERLYVLQEGRVLYKVGTCGTQGGQPRHWLDHRLGAAHTLLAQGHPLHLWGQQL